MEFRFRGGRKETILPAGAEAEPKAQPKGPLVLALARAYRCQGMLDTGQVSSTDAFARNYDPNRSHLGRILKLTSLAPDLVAAIVSGDEPSGLSVAKLQKNVSVAWEKERQELLLRSLAE